MLVLFSLLCPKQTNTTKAVWRRKVHSSRKQSTPARVGRGMLAAPEAAGHIFFYTQEAEMNAKCIACFLLFLQSGSPAHGLLLLSLKLGLLTSVFPNQKLLHRYVVWVTLDLVRLTIKSNHLSWKYLQYNTHQVVD